LDDRAKAPFVVSSAGYNKPVDELKAIDKATLLKIKNGEDDVHGLFIESYMILDEVVGDEDGAGYILQPWADVQRIGDAIANSTNLLSLDIQEFGDTEMVVADQWLFDVFLDSLAIDPLSICRKMTYTILHGTPWRLYFLSSNTTAASAALLLCDSNQLERISLHCNNLEAIQVTRFINALGDHHNLLA